MALTRRSFGRAAGSLIVLLPAALRAGQRTIRGRLTAGPKPVLVSLEGARIALMGDKSTMLVLADPRLNGKSLEVTGDPVSELQFRVGPIHTNALRVLQDGKGMLITYWCETCAIRTFAPGVCMCCQEDTALDLRESL